MSTKAVIGWLVVAVVLGLGVVLALRTSGAGGTGGGIAINERVMPFSPSAVRKLTVGPAGAGSLPDVLERADSATGGWLMRLGGPRSSDVDWPVAGPRVDALLSLLSEARAVAIPQRGGELGEMPTEVTLDRTDGGPITLRFAERTIGGAGLVEVVMRGESGETTSRAMVNDQLHQLVRDRGARAWRDRTAMPWALSDVSRLKLESSNKVLALGRIDGRWGLREPIAAPADHRAVEAMIGTLGGVEIAEFMDDGAPGIDTGVAQPQSKVAVEVDRRDLAAATNRPAVNTIRHTLDIGSRADASGERLFALIDGKRLVKINAVGISKLTLDPGAYLSAHPTAVNASSVGMLVLERLDAKGVPTDDGRVLKRSLDRWVELAGGNTPQALPDEVLKDVAATLAFLTGSDATAAARPETHLDAPEAYRAGARVSLRSLDDAPLAEVEIGMSSISALTAVRTGDVYRVYPLDRLPRLIAQVMQASPAINPPRAPGSDSTPDENK